MNKKEIRKELINEGMYDIDNSTFIYTSQEIDLIASKIEAKINFTHCCTELCDCEEPFIEVTAEECGGCGILIKGE
jgi:hypothetical protein